MPRELLKSAVLQNALKDVARVSRADWSLLGNAHLLLTGGTGFFGSWIIASFAAARAQGLPTQIELTVLSRDPERFLQLHPSLRTVKGLSFRRGDVASATIPFNVTHIMHVATSEVDAGGSAKESPIVTGTRHMLSEAKRVGAARFLFASSGAVYGRAPSQSPGTPDYSDNSVETALHSDAQLTPAGLAKREAELLCREAAASRETETVIARGFNFCGPLFPLDGPYVVSTFLSAILNRLPIQVKSPLAVRSFLDGRDFATAYWRLLARGRSGEAYNVGSDESVTMSELADFLRAVAWKTSLHVPEIRASRVMQSADVFRPSIRKMRNELGWSPTVSLRESLLAQAQWATEPVDNSEGSS